MPLLEILRALNAAAIYWTGEPMDLGAAIATLPNVEGE